MKTVVLDDDPTGTQSATGVQVLLESDADRLEAALRDADGVYVQTNSRALDEASAVALVARIRADALEAGARLGVEVRFVLRGDSTLRGHVFAETGVFAGAEDVVLFVPAFPAGDGPRSAGCTSSAPRTVTCPRGRRSTRATPSSASAAPRWSTTSPRSPPAPASGSRSTSSATPRGWRSGSRRPRWVRCWSPTSRRTGT